MSSWAFAIIFIIFIIIVLIAFGVIWFELPARPTTTNGTATTNGTFVSLNESEYNAISTAAIAGIVITILFIIILLFVWIFWGTDTTETVEGKDVETTVTKTSVTKTPVEKPTVTTTRESVTSPTQSRVIVAPSQGFSTPQARHVIIPAATSVSPVPPAVTAGSPMAYMASPGGQSPSPVYIYQ